MFSLFDLWSISTLDCEYSAGFRFFAFENVNERYYQALLGANYLPEERVFELDLFWFCISINY
jgi:hypothetical protein